MAVPYTIQEEEKSNNCEGYQGGYIKHVTWYCFWGWKCPYMVVIIVIRIYLFIHKWFNHSYHQSCIDHALCMSKKLAIIIIHLRVREWDIYYKPILILVRRYPGRLPRFCFILQIVGLRRPQIAYLSTGTFYRS